MVWASTAEKVRDPGAVTWLLSDMSHWEHWSLKLSSFFSEVVCSRKTANSSGCISARLAAWQILHWSVKELWKLHDLQQPRAA